LVDNNQLATFSNVIMDQAGLVGLIWRLPKEQIMSSQKSKSISVIAAVRNKIEVVSPLPVDLAT
jgi:hypothetical protein